MTIPTAAHRRRDPARQDDGSGGTRAGGAGVDAEVMIVAATEQERAAELPAGRELDRLIAERVFGLEVKPMHVIGRGPDVGTVDPPRVMSDGRRGVACHALPAYSTKIADAWRVVEWLMNDPIIDALVKIEGERSHSRTWTVWVTSHDMSEVFAEGQDLPLVICRAALAACEARP